MRWLKGCLKVLLALLALGLIGLFALYMMYRTTPTDIPIQTTVNGTIRIVIDSNPTTGYRWVPEIDNQTFELVNDGYMSFAQRPGAGGFQTIHIKALKSGTYKLHMKYMRARGIDVIKEVDYTVIVK